MTQGIKVRSGSVVLLRLFDVAYGIDLAVAESRLAQKQAFLSQRHRFTRAHPKSLSLEVPPLQITLPGRLDLIPGCNVQVVSTIYDFGTVSIALHCGVQGLAWEEYVEGVNRIGEWSGSDVAEKLWKEIREKVCEALGPALSRPSESPLEEDYLLAIVNETDVPGVATSRDLMDRIDVIPLLSGEVRSLSEAEEHDLLRHQYSYYEDDLAIIRWDRAFLYEPHGETDVASILEIANAQLLGLRSHSQILDRELPMMFDRLEAARSTARALSRSRHTKLARDMHRLVSDVTEMRERVDNALQVTEDVYLARIYSGALELFRTRTWAGAVERKLAIIRDTCDSLLHEASSARTEFLEITIILLILFDIVMSFVRY